MKKLILLITAISIISCQTTKVDNDTFKVTNATTEIGSIGHATTLLNLKNNFYTHAFPILNNNIRLDVKLLPFDKKTYNIYFDKTKTLQQKPAFTYIDSLPEKPKYAVIKLLDIGAYTNEINGIHNNKIANYLIDTEKSVVVTGIAISLKNEDLNKINGADSYYLINNMDSKYTLGLFKQGKLTDTVDLQSGISLSYRLGKFCWALDDREQWYVADIVSTTVKCEGSTKEKIKEKKQENLFKM